MDSLLAFFDPELILATVAGLALAYTVFSIIGPMFDNGTLDKRMRAVVTEREKIRARERAKMMEAQKHAALRARPKQFMADIVERFSLEKLFLDDNSRRQLKMAGFRGESPIIVFLYARFVLPFIFFAVALFWLFVVNTFGMSTFQRAMISMGIGVLGVFAPVVYISNTINKRQKSIRRAFPDALDMLLICVESGMSNDAGFKRVAEEIGVSSIPLAEEMMLTSAELAFLQDRRQALENFSYRTGLNEVKSVVLALQQADRYGTPIGSALRVLSQENRDARLAEAERKASALPPKLTVPMILFFVPVLMVVILTPAYISVTHMMGTH